MVTAALSNYQPFQYSIDMFENTGRVIDTPSDGWLEVALKVCEVTLRILSLIPLFIFDLLMMPASWIYIELFEDEPPAPPPLPNRIERPEEVVPEVPVQPEPPVELTTIERIMGAESYEVQQRQDENYLPLQYIRFLNRAPEIQNRNNLTIMLNSVINGLKILPERSRKLYLEMIANDGPPNVGDAPVEIFAWMNKCLIIYTMCCRAHRDFLHGLFPQAPLSPRRAPQLDATIQNLAAHRESCREIRVAARRFARLSEDQRATVIYQALVDGPLLPQSQEVIEILQIVNAQSMNLAQDYEYRNQVLNPFFNPFKILIEESGILDQ